MTIYPLDLTLAPGTTGEQMAAAFSAVPSGRDLLVNINGQSAPFDAKALVNALGDLDGITTLNLRVAADPAWVDPAKALAEFCSRKGCAFHVDLLVPADGDVPEFIIHNKGTLLPMAEATRAFASQNLPVRWLIPLSPEFVYRLEGLVSLAFQLGVTPVLLPPTMIDSGAPDLSGDDRLFAWDFITYRILDEDAQQFSSQHLKAYQALATCLKQEPEDNSIERQVENWGIVEPGNPTLDAPRRYGAIGKALLAKGGNQDKAGYSKGEILARKLSDIADVASFGIPAHLRNLVTPTPKPGQPDPEMPYVLLIGAYGGEHIGDAAILGGVLGRIHARHGTHRAILMTQRPNHTRHLIPMLDVPVDVEVQEYTRTNIANALRHVDGVVFAGGPLAEMPKQLVRHLETVTRAKRRDLPFIMEGIGPSTFSRMPSHVTARKLVQKADRISIRVKDDARREVIAGCQIEIGRDPAFDYLETRSAELTRFPQHEPAEIDELLKGTENRPIVGINVRPIGHTFTPSQAGRDRAAYSREIEGQCERELAQGLMKYARETGTNPCFVFFPMNSIQFGMSDLRSAWRIIQHLEPGTDFRIWQADASLDGVVALLRRMDIVVAMRFHAAIFALSQNLPVIGIDYRIGKRDKVAAVLADAGFEENCRRIDELQSDWLAERLQTLAPKKSPMSVDR